MAAIEYLMGCALNGGVKKSEKALCAMPKGPFIVGNYQFLSCADLENVRCLSIRNESPRRFLFNYIMSQKTDQIAILKLALKNQI